MTNNKVNVELIVPGVLEKYNLFLPVNKTIGEIIVILNKTINEITGNFPINNQLCILDVVRNVIYDPNTALINSGIKKTKFGFQILKPEFTFSIHINKKI